MKNNSTGQDGADNLRSVRYHSTKTVTYGCDERNHLRGVNSPDYRNMAKAVVPIAQ